MRRSQGPVLWIGGGCGAGKSSVARAISRRFDLQLYAADAHGYAHLARTTGSSRPAASHDQRWLEPSPEELAERFLRETTEKFPLVLEDLAALAADGPLVVAEGPTMLPDLVYPHLDSPQHALFLMPTEDFQRRMLARRGGGASLATSDPARAHANLLARNRLLDRAIAARATALGLPVMEVDGSFTLAESERRVAERFAAAIGEGPRAADGAARRRIRRRENAAVHANVSAYLQDIGVADADAAPPMPLACECTTLGCIAEVGVAPGAFSAVVSRPDRYVVAPGHGAIEERIVDILGEAQVIEAPTGE